MQTDSILLSCSKILRKHHRILVYFVTWRDTWNISRVAAWFWWHTYSCLSSLLFVMFQATREIPKPGEEWSYSSMLVSPDTYWLRPGRLRMTIKAPKFLCGMGISHQKRRTEASGFFEVPQAICMKPIWKPVL